MGSIEGKLKFDEICQLSADVSRLMTAGVNVHDWETIFAAYERVKARFGSHIAGDFFSNKNFSSNRSWI